MGETTTSAVAVAVAVVDPATSLGRDFDRERDFRCGRFFGTCRYCDDIVDMARTCMEGTRAGQAGRARSDACSWLSRTEVGV